MFEKIVVVTRKTRLEELIARFNTRGQARFYLESAGLDFADYADEDDTYRRALERLGRQLEVGLRLQWLDRALVSTFVFTEKDLVVAVGQDGLVANTAKYVGAQPLVGVNPDPKRFDGVLLPFRAEDARGAVERTIEGHAQVREVTLAEARLADGQRLLGFNDLYLGARTHVSARYKLGYGKKQEAQSSSGVLVSTGAGSTGWLSSVFNMAGGIAAMAGAGQVSPVRLGWEDPRLFYVVREPFVSKHSAASLVCGWIEPGQSLAIESLMPTAGVIFGDGMEADYLDFNSGAVASLAASKQRARLVTS